jgi:hypothetical protein
MKYSQKTGNLTTNDGKLIAVGYSGHGLGKNNPEMESVKNVGPLPKGIYQIGTPYNSTRTGPFTLPLIPDPQNKMYKRSDFKIHGDSLDDPGTASHGCIILQRKVREAIYNGTDKLIEVY